MDIELNKAVLEDALFWVNRFLVSRNGTTAMTSVHIQTTSDKEILFSAANIETYTEVNKEAHVNKEGDVIVNGKALLDIVHLMPDTGIHLHTSDDDGKLHIEAKNSKHAIPLVRTEIIKQKFEDLNEVAQISYDDFSKLLDQVGIAVAKEDSTPILTTVHFVIKGNQLEANAIDRYRVAKKVIDIKNTNKAEAEFNVKFKNLSVIVNGLDNSENIVVKYDENSHKFCIESLDKKTVSTLISGDFPSTTSLFKDEYKAVLTVDRKEFQSAIARSSILIESSRGITFTITAGKINITSDEEEVSASEQIDCDYAGDDIVMKFNPDYIKDGLSKLETDELRIKIDEPSKPVEFIGLKKDKESSDYRYVIVPIRDI
jgi:DNA polymerase-3 subunit beta